MVGSSLTNIKFLCSYGGKILPRYPDGKLRYHGGETRVLSVDRSISFSELLVKLKELCGNSVILRCQWPTEDLDALVSITCDEDLVNLIEEYDRVALSKIRAFLSLPKSNKKPSPTPSTASSSSNTSPPKSPSLRFPIAGVNRCVRQMTKPAMFPMHYGKSARKVHCYGNQSRVYLIDNGNHWQ